MPSQHYNRRKCQIIENRDPRSMLGRGALVALPQAVPLIGPVLDLSSTAWLRLWLLCAGLTLALLLAAKRRDARWPARLSLGVLLALPASAGLCVAAAALGDHRDPVSAARSPASLLSRLRDHRDPVSAARSPASLLSRLSSSTDFGDTLNATIPPSRAAVTAAPKPTTASQAASPAQPSKVPSDGERDVSVVRRTLDGWLDPLELVSPRRFDIVAKTAVVLAELAGRRSEFVWGLYREHERRFNNFREDEKRSATDFQLDFVRLQESIRLRGFRAEEAVEVCYRRHDRPRRLFPWNGAHRTAVTAALGIHVKVKRSPAAVGNSTVCDFVARWDYGFFDQPHGSNAVHNDLAFYQWLRFLQDRKRIRLLTLWPLASQLDKGGRVKDPVRHFLKASNSSHLLWMSKTLKLTPKGLLNYAAHAYGAEAFLQDKWHKALGGLSRTSAKTVAHIRLYWLEEAVGEGLETAKHGWDGSAKSLRDRVRRHYHPHQDAKYFKDTIHCTDGRGDTLLLSQMALFNESIFYMNTASDYRRCMRSAEELGKLMGLPEVVPSVRLNLSKTEPEFVVDSGSAVDAFGLRNRTDFDLVYDTQKSKDIARFITKTENVEGHGSTGGGGLGVHEVPVAEFLADPRYYFFCFGRRFTSAPQLVAYKTRRNVQPKDRNDVRMLRKLLEDRERWRQ